MLNYIWLALILIAVLYAGYRDFTDKPPMIEAATISLEGFPGGRIDPAGGLSVAEKIDLSDERWNAPHSLGKPAQLNLEVAELSEAASVDVLFSDKDGESFALTGLALEKSDKATVVKAALADLKAAEANPEATLDYPLTIDLIRVDRTAEAPVEIKSLALHFPKQLFVSDKLEAKTWMGVVTASTTNWAKTSIELAIGLIGIMMLWLGVMRIAEASGLVQLLAKALKPVMVWLFPDLPPEGEAMGAIIMNMAANMLGLGNAATPLGLKAMEEIQKVNPNKEYASNAMCMLLSLNTSSVTLITPTIIAYRAATGSTDIMRFWPVMILATLCSTVTAVIVCKLLENLPVFAVPPATENQKEVASA